MAVPVRFRREHARRDRPEQPVPRQLLRQREDGGNDAQVQATRD